MGTGSRVSCVPGLVLVLGLCGHKTVTINHWPCKEHPESEQDSRGLCRRWLLGQVIRPESVIRQDLILLLEAQLTEQRKRWGFI